MPKVLLVSDQPVLVGGFQEVLECRGFDVIVGDPSSLPSEKDGVRPDLVLLDLTAGLTFGNLTEVNAHLPGCPVVIWAEAMPLDTVFRALEFGVRGIVERSSSAEHLADSLRRVAGGEMQIGFAATREATPARRRVTLTPREREIVLLLRRGLRNKQIASEMGITEGTVKIYLFRLFHKLDVRNRFELARCGAVDDMAPPPPPAKPVGASSEGPRVSPAARKTTAIDGEPVTLA
ncbi:MAG TPA: response regulator transcription factor [Bryobacteraceae bacterium]|nr:response regulator transcription factor [Bryobacteraceae bacterium]